MAEISPSGYITFDDFSGGMNTQSARQGLPEKFAAWMENLQPIAPNYLLGVPAPTPTLITIAGETIVKSVPALIGTQDYQIAFTLLGAAYAIPILGQGSGRPVVVSTPILIAPDGTFSATGGDVTNYNGDRILIADAAAGYCTWNGTLFVGQGGVSPNFIVTAGGSGYTSGATATISGGSGSGATVSVTTTAGVVTGIVLTNPGTGYLAGDTLTVSIAARGAGAGATANGHVWPFVTPPPTTLAVAFGRVWLAAGRILICTGVGSTTFGAGYDDFSPSDGSVTSTISDADLVEAITALRYISGYLYIFGDNSVKSIGAISISSGNITSFTITPLSSDQGTVYMSSVVSYNRLLLFANTVGVFAIFGASVEKISDPMDGVFRAVDFSFGLWSAVNDIDNIHVYLLLVRYLDPAAGPRALILSYAGKKWFVCSQGSGLNWIVTSTLEGITETFGSSGSDLTQILQSNAALPYKLQTSLSPHGDPIHDKRVIALGVAQTSPGDPTDMAITIDTEYLSEPITIAYASTNALVFVNNSGGALVFVNNSGGVITFITTAFALGHTSRYNTTGRYIGATLRGTLQGTAVQGIFIKGQQGAEWGKG